MDKTNQEKIQKMLQTREKRLQVKLSSIRKFNREYADGYFY